MPIDKLTSDSTLKEWRETINKIIDILEPVSSSNDGLMSVSDKLKLDSIDVNNILYYFETK